MGNKNSTSQTYIKSGNVNLDVGNEKGKRNHDILAKTLVGEAADEDEIGQRAICWVIYNRVKGNKIYWYDEDEGNTIAGVCLKDQQFECWNKGEKRRQLKKTLKSDWGKRKRREINKWLSSVYTFRKSDGKPVGNPIGKCDHYNNPKKEKRPDWMDKVDYVKTIGNHFFYRTKPEFR